MAPKKRKAIATTALVASGKGKGNNVGIKKNTKLCPTTEFEYTMMMTMMMMKMMMIAMKFAG